MRRPRDRATGEALRTMFAIILISFAGAAFLGFVMPKLVGVQ